MRVEERIPRSVKSVVKVARAEVFRRLGSDRFSWPAINDLDRQLVDRLPERGVFLEIGANDGYSQSNTYYLEKYRGWAGILVEPLPSMFRLCRLHRRKARCFNFACVAPDGPSSIELVDRGLMAVATSLVATDEEARRRRGDERRVVEVPTRTLSSLIDEARLGRPNLMSVDVEGAELAVLAGLEERHLPDLLLVETVQPDAVDLALPGMQRVGLLSNHDWLFEKPA